ncbi:hypothetical protein QQ054_06840 [Oscillatoria amoena NRMC-F 0135]|nr:hypothetical protein [Oscillatoria amoena NRMC-F 0135]
MNRSKSKYYFLILLLFLLQGCLGTRHLKENEKLIYKQKVTAPKTISKSKLEELTGVETNRKFLFMPIHLLVYMYYTGERNFRPDKFQKKKEKKIKKTGRKKLHAPGKTNGLTTCNSASSKKPKNMMTGYRTVIFLCSGANRWLFLIQRKQGLPLIGSRITFLPTATLQMTCVMKLKKPHPLALA